MTDFGAFIELEEGIDALLHVSQISIEHVEKPSDVLKVGQEVTAKVVDFNEETKKISLSIKALEIEKKKEAEAEAEAAEEVEETAQTEETVQAEETTQVEENTEASAEMAETEEVSAEE